MKFKSPITIARVVGLCFAPLKMQRRENLGLCVKPTHATGLHEWGTRILAREKYGVLPRVYMEHFATESAGNVGCPSSRCQIYQWPCGSDHGGEDQRGHSRDTLVASSP